MSYKIKDQELNISFGEKDFRFAPEIEVLKREGENPFAFVTTKLPEDVAANPDYRRETQLTIAGSISKFYNMPNDSHLMAFVELPNKNFEDQPLEIRKHGRDNPFPLIDGRPNEVSENKVDLFRMSAESPSSSKPDKGPGQPPPVQGVQTEAPIIDLSKESFSDRGPQR